MKRSNIIDTFPAFLAFWENVQNDPIAFQIDGWQTSYMAQWPDLLDKQLMDYASQQEDWQKVASEKVFPYIGMRLPAMEVAHRNIISLYPLLCEQAYEKIDAEINPTGVIYVGIGCGAGWVTTYKDELAILFGLENIAECGWSDSKSISGLIAHELGHVIHDIFRRQVNLKEDEGACWQLFSEGFAQRCEHLILGQHTWHEAAGSNPNWLSWCQANKAYLASRFLQLLAEGRDPRPFFGSWYNINGYSQSGYFLGHAVIEELETSGISIREVGMLEHYETPLRQILEHFAKDEPGAGQAVGQHLGDL